MDYVSLTTDVWTDTLNNSSFLGLTLHYILEEQLKSNTAGLCELGERHTADYIHDKIKSILFEWNIPIIK